MNLIHLQIKVADKDSKDLTMVEYFIEALRYFAHGRLNTNLRVFLITDLQ